jgi:hypothetical protein
MSTTVPAGPEAGAMSIAVRQSKPKVVVGVGVDVGVVAARGGVGVAVAEGWPGVSVVHNVPR